MAIGATEFLNTSKVRPDLVKMIGELQKLNRGLYECSDGI